jgi:hypothetical protein
METTIGYGKQLGHGSNKPYHACSLNVSHCFKICMCHPCHLNLCT